MILGNILCAVTTKSTLISDKHTECKRIIRHSGTNEMARMALGFSPIVFQQILRAYEKHMAALISKMC
jgi:hypothetical protein